MRLRCPYPQSLRPRSYLRPDPTIWNHRIDTQHGRKSTKATPTMLGGESGARPLIPTHARANISAWTNDQRPQSMPGALSWQRRLRAWGCSPWASRRAALLAGASKECLILSRSRLTLSCPCLILSRLSHALSRRPKLNEAKCYRMRQSPGGSGPPGAQVAIALD